MRIDHNVIHPTTLGVGAEIVVECNHIDVQAIARAGAIDDVRTLLAAGGLGGPEVAVAVAYLFAVKDQMLAKDVGNGARVRVRHWVEPDPKFYNPLNVSVHNDVIVESL